MQNFIQMELPCSPMPTLLLRNRYNIDSCIWVQFNLNVRTQVLNEFLILFIQDYVLPEVRDRQFLISFHKNARKIGMDVEKYNELRTKASKIETDLQRLRDPLALHLPLKTRTGMMDGGTHRLYSTETSKCIIGKAQQKFQHFLQKAQKTSSSPST